MLDRGDLIISTIKHHGEVKMVKVQIENGMATFDTGHIGFSLALQLYGAKAIVNAGDFYSIAVIRIPEEDLPTFEELEKEMLERYRNPFKKYDALASNNF